LHAELLTLVDEDRNLDGELPKERHMMEQNSTWNITDYDVSDLDITIVKFLFDAFERFKIKYCPNPPFVGYSEWWSDFFEVYDGLRAYLGKNKYYDWDNMELVPVTQEWLDEDSGIRRMLYSKKGMRPSDQHEMESSAALAEEDAAKKVGLRKLGQIIPYLWGTWTEDNFWIDGKLDSPIVDEAVRRYEEHKFNEIVENYD
jgi:hypothetical protein